MSNELHISSLLVHGKTSNKTEITAAINSLPGAEIHAISEQGKFVVTLETASEAEIISHIDHINRIDGVLSTVLVYHHCEDLDALEEEVRYEDDSPRIY